MGNLFKKLASWFSDLFRRNKPAAQAIFDASKPAIIEAIQEAVDAACAAGDPSQVRGLLLSALDKLGLPAYVEVPVSLILASFDISNTVGTLQQKIRAEGARLQDQIRKASL
jgi:hypothetical protein